MYESLGIVLVNFNGLTDTLECIESIRHSTFQGFHIIVVDNGSSEDCSALSDAADVTLVHLKENVGFGVANNIGAKTAMKLGVDCLLCLNNDTIVDPLALERMLRRLDDQTVVTCATYQYNAPTELWYGGGEVSRLTGKFHHMHYLECREVTFASGCCLMLTVDCYRAIGLFAPEYFMYYEDADFSLKVLLSGRRIWYEYNARIWHKVGRSIRKQPGARDYYLTRNRLYILNKYKSFFFASAWLYFYATRLIMIILCSVKRVSAAPYRDALSDYSHGKMGPAERESL